MLDPVGFWSYARHDDTRSGGDLSQLRVIVGNAIELQYGAEITLWQDITAIPYGADWADTIERTLGQTTFFMPIVTPRFLKSQNCFEEFVSFRRQMRALGRDDLVFAVHYVNVDDMRAADTVFGDELATLRRHQWIDFRPFRYTELRSGEVRRWADGLAASILRALRRPAPLGPSDAGAAGEERSAPHAAGADAVVAEAVPPTDGDGVPPRPAPPPRGPVPPSVSAAAVAGETAHDESERARGAAAASEKADTLRVGANGDPPPTKAKDVDQGLSLRTVVIASAALLAVLAVVWISVVKTAAPRVPSVPSTSPPPVPSAAALPSPPPVAAGACGGATLASLGSRAEAPLSAGEECALKPKDEFRECEHCPAMVVVPPGSFTMGSPASEPGRDPDEGPQHSVKLAKAFAVGKFQVTVDEFKAFVSETGYDAGSKCYVWTGTAWDEKSGSWRDPGFAQAGSHPATCLSWNDAQAYVAWLAKRTGRGYRLLSEAEWEYAARGRTDLGSYPRYFFGDAESDMCRYGNGADQAAKRQVPGASGWAVFPCDDGFAYTSPVGSFLSNAFGLYDMHGNVWQWTQDCYMDSYTGAPTDGRALTTGDCSRRVLRGGSWYFGPGVLRAAIRNWYTPVSRYYGVGFRLARTLTP